MDKHNRYMTKDQDAARSIVLERQQRISIEESSRMMIKNTQTQVRELYRREKQKFTVEQNLIPPEKSSSLSDGKIIEARIQVDSLNEQIVNEIGRLKSYRDYVIHADSNRSSSRSGSRQRQPLSNRTWGQSLASNNSNVNITDEDPEDTNRSQSQNNPITPRSQESRPRFRTLGVKPSSKQEKELRNMVQAEKDTENSSSQERICGGCTFGNNNQTHCSVYQCDYGQSSALSRQCPTHCIQPQQMMMSSSLSHPPYPGQNICICCEYQPPGSSSPMSQAANQMYPYSTGTPACQQQSIQQSYPNSVDVQNYNMYPCTTVYPNYTRRVTDLNTQDFCGLWCQNPRESRSPSNARCSKSSTKESVRTSSARSRTLSRSPSSARTKFGNQVKKKLKDAGISDSTSLAQYKVQDHEKIMKVTLRKQAQPDYQKSAKTVNEQMIIKDYIPAKSSKRNDSPTYDYKPRRYKEYMNLYEKENQKTYAGGGGRRAAKEEGPEVEAHPTYTKIQDLRPAGSRIPQSSTIHSYGPTKTKSNQSSQRRSGQDSGKSTKLPQSMKKPTPAQEPQKDGMASTLNNRDMDLGQRGLDSSQIRKKSPSPTPQQEKQQQQQQQQQPKDQIEALKPEVRPYTDQSQRPWDEERNLVENIEQSREESVGEKEDSEESEKSHVTENQMEEPKDIRQEQAEDEMRAQLIQTKNQLQQDSNYAASKDQSHVKEKPPPTQTIEEKQSEFNRKSRDNISIISPLDSVNKQKDQSHQLTQQEQQPQEQAHVQDKDSDSGLGRYSDSGNQKQSDENRQSIPPISYTEHKTEPTDKRWGTKEGHRLSLEPISFVIPEERMELGSREIESTTSICRTWSQHLVSIKRSNKEGGPLIRRETKRYDKECVSYITKDIGLESELPESTKSKTQIRSSSKHGNKRSQRKMSQISDNSRSSDSLDPTNDIRQFATMPRMQEERLTQTEILWQEARPTQTDLDANREERRTQTEPDERRERLTQTDLLLTNSTQERLTQTELAHIPNQTGYINIQKDQTEQLKNNVIPQYPKSDADRMDEISESSGGRSKDNFEGHISGDKSDYPKPNRKRNQQKSSLTQTEQNETIVDDQSQLQNLQRRTPAVPSSSYYSLEPQEQKTAVPALPSKQQTTSFPGYQSDENNTLSQQKGKESSNNMPGHGGLHQVPTQHNLNRNIYTAKELSESSEQFERSDADGDRYIADPEEIICRQYRQNLKGDPQEIAYRQQQISASRARQPEYQSPNRREQWEYSYQSGESCEGPSTSKTNTIPISQTYINSYEWRRDKHMNPENLHERCATYRQRVQRLNCKSADSTEGTISSEYSDICSSYNDDYYTAQQMSCNSQYDQGVPPINQMNCNPYGESPLYYYQQQQNGRLPQDERTQYYSQYPLNPNQRMAIPAYNTRTNTIQVPQHHFYNRPQRRIVDNVNQLPSNTNPNPHPNTNPPNPNCMTEKRMRTVKFDDEHDGQIRIRRDTAETLRSTIDWDRAYRQGLLSDKMRSGYLSESESDIMNTCRSSSSANTEVTCIDCNCEEECLTCDQETPQNRFQRLPPYSGCPCMLNTYIHLATLHTNK